MKNTIYGRLFNFQLLIFSLIFRVIIILFLILAGLHFNENPVVISIIIIIGLTLIIVFSVDRMLLLNSTGFVSRRTIFGIWNKNETIEYSNIEIIIFTGDFTLGKDLIASVIPSGWALERPNKIIIKLNDGSLKEYPSFAYKKKAKSFVDIGNKLVNEKKPAHNKSS